MYHKEQGYPILIPLEFVLKHVREGAEKPLCCRQTGWEQLRGVPSSNCQGCFHFGKENLKSALGFHLFQVKIRTFKPGWAWGKVTLWFYQVRIYLLWNFISYSPVEWALTAGVLTFWVNTFLSRFSLGTPSDEHGKEQCIWLYVIIYSGKNGAGTLWVVVISGPKFNHPQKSERSGKRHLLSPSADAYTETLVPIWRVLGV